MKKLINAVAYLTSLNLACALTDIPIEIIEEMERYMTCKIPKGIDSILEVSYCIGSAIGCLSCVPIFKKF